MKSISSKDNQLFKLIKKLATSSKDRVTEGKTLLDGEHLIESYLSVIGMPELVILSETTAADFNQQSFLKRLDTTKLIVMPDALFRELSPVKTPTGMIAQIAIPVNQSDVGQIEFGLLLEDIQDPGNLGAILRSAAAAGVQSVFLSKKCVDAWSPKVLRAGMGAHFHLRIHENADLIKVADKLKGLIVATSLDAQVSLFNLDLTGPVTFMIGNEGAGLSAQLEDVATERILIPMPGKIESLNAAAAASVCFFERVRQRQLLSS